MDDFTTEDIISFINLCMTLSDEEKNTLKLRVMDELEQNEDHLSKKLSEDLAKAFEAEMKHIEEDFLPEQDMKINAAQREYDDELEVIQPDLNELVETYRKETAELENEYLKEFNELDKAFDLVVQEDVSQKEAHEIAAIKQKLASKPKKSTD